MPYLTGDDIPENTTCRVIRVPDDPVFRSTLRGALLELTYERNWEQFGTLTPAEVAEAWLNIVWEFESEVCVMGIVGEIRFFGLTTPPDGWLECNGAYISQATYPALFDAIGENFGFAVGGNFVLPDMRFRTPLGLGELGGSSPYEVGLGQQAGQEEVALSTNELPAHSHQLLNNNSAARFRHSGAAGSNASDGVLAGTTNNATAIMTTSAGSGNAFPLIQPGIGLLACIYAGE